MDLIKQKNKEKLLKEAQKLRGQMKGDVESAKLIREYRNSKTEPELRPEFIEKIKRREKQKPIKYDF